MFDELDYDVPALVGILFSDKIVYNVIECDGEFQATGMSIITFLNNNRNLFVAKIFESQSYDSIKILLDDSMIFGNFHSTSNSNVDEFKDIYTLMTTINDFNYYYIYDFMQDLLLIRLPHIDEIIALDYRNELDVKNFINKIKNGV